MGCVRAAVEKWWSGSGSSVVVVASGWCRVDLGGWVFFFLGGSVPEAKGQPTGELLRARAQNETS